MPRLTPDSIIKIKKILSGRKIIIGLSGVATSGKDTLYLILEELLSECGIKTKRVALADRLKSDMSSFIHDKFEIDAFTQNKEEKTIIRPLFVAYGKSRRIQSKGTYWTSKIQYDVDFWSNQGVIPIITDIRYDDYPEDELFWIKKNHGVLIHITRIGKDGLSIQPPNEDEARNDPKIRAASDFQLTWDTAEEGIISEKMYALALAIIEGL